jgi:glyoxylase-like metal-dependent hydrolase (beta-lactamase superfamily II)
VACPTASIGADDRRAAAAAAREFPVPITEDVFYCGFASEKSFGGSSYFVRHPEGNWLIDSPRFVEHLARRFVEMGGVRHIFLTHRDDVADAAKYAARFGAARIIHRLELAAQPNAERVIDGFEPVELEPEFLAIPTPGHTRGHCALLHREFLFTGDHLCFSRRKNRLNASWDVCWYSWPEQVKSVERLAAYDFEWVLPGHGERAHMSAAEMRRQLRLAAT